MVAGGGGGGRRGGEDPEAVGGLGRGRGGGGFHVGGRGRRRRHGCGRRGGGGGEGCGGRGGVGDGVGVSPPGGEEVERRVVVVMPQVDAGRTGEPKSGKQQIRFAF